MTTLTRQQAATELVDGAIGAWFDRRYACAITLAGAAETGMPTPANGPSMFGAMRAAVMKFGHLSESAAATKINESRNWLKHYGEDKSETISVELAWVDVLRAYWHFQMIYKEAEKTPNMIRFQAVIDEETEPLRQAARGFAAWVKQVTDILSGRRTG